MKYLPDTPKEYAFIGSSIARLGTAMSGVLLFEANKYWVIATLVLTWLGHEVAQYFKLQAGEPAEDETNQQNP
jgi:hypothetical protein